MPRPHRVDVLIAVAGLLGGLALWAIGLGLRTSPVPELPDAWLLVPLVLMSALELLRRTLPQTALAAGTLLLVADQFTPGSLVTILLFADLAYAAVLYGSPAAARRIPWTTGLVTVASTIAFVAWFQKPEAVLLGVMVGLVGFAPATTGAIVRNHRDAAETARLRAEQTALLAEMDRAQAVIAERARMARELHDMVANHLSAIAIHSTAALSLDDPGTTRDALGVIRENSVDGLAEMRRLIGLLRDGSGDHEPAAAPTLEGLGTLTGQARANGLDLHLDDRRPPGSPRLPAPVELAAYRIVQESLTNALKHAAPGPVHVTLDLSDGTLTVTVTSPFGEPSGPRAPGSGAGLVGMRERATLLGGRFEAAPRDDGRGKVWYVRAVLPAGEAVSHLSQGGSE
ncbi:sensor histidine kinase [Streptomyces boluensis]|uniref:histidine kinase n=1 Tax=Streptomyces boluensis TaxID=1775135 RepID=A0A964XL99_9ACTN|nr:histidine kinase [Streptomyces boluensis]NBE51532.1 two-component sensor histidine kinase [Streptomyces boluensis]